MIKLPDELHGISAPVIKQRIAFSTKQADVLSKHFPIRPVIARQVVICTLPIRFDEILPDTRARINVMAVAMKPCT